MVGPGRVDTRAPGQEIRLGLMSTQLSYEPAESATQGFLEAFRRHGAGVSIVTLRLPSGQPTGFTATSLSSLSLLPPRATFNMSTMASSYPAIMASETLLIHTLAYHNRDLAEKFSGDANQRFTGINLLEGPDNLPLIPGASAFLHGSIVARHTVGEAAIIAVEILGGGVAGDGDALVYQHQSYRAAADV